MTKLRAFDEHTTHWRWWALTLLIAASGCAPEPSSAEGAHAIVLVSFDTTRPDHLEPYGSADAKTPTLAALAQDGVRFDAARAPAPITLPSHTTMMTGVEPCAHGVRDNAFFALAEQGVTLAEVLQKGGYRTGGFVGTFVLDARFGLAQGFDHYTSPAVEAAGTDPTVIQRSASEVVDDAIAWLDEVPSEDPVFLFVHFYDPHADHYFPPGMEGQFEDPYDAEIAYCDAQLARLLDRVERDRDTTVAMTSDHGESFGEHGEKTHGIFVYDATQRVPLILRSSRIDASGAVVDAPVSLVDLAPTLLTLAEIDVDAPASFGAPSLLTAITTPDSERPVYLESLLPYHSYRWHPLRSIVWRGYKVIDSPVPELYELSSDPDEEHNLAGDQPDLLIQMQRRLEAYVATQESLGWGQSQEVSAADRELFAKLGYVAGGTGGDPFDSTLPDAKERIGDLDRHMEVRVLLQQGQQLSISSHPNPELRNRQHAQGREALLRARELLTNIREAHPQDPEVDKSLGFLEMTMGRYADAIEPLERHCVHSPSSVGARFNLAVCYARVGKGEWARREMWKVASIEPRFTRAAQWLAIQARDRNDAARAVFWLEYWLEHAPSNERGPAQDQLTSARRAMQERGEQSSGPGGFPVEDLVPEGVRARETADDESP